MLFLLLRLLGSPQEVVADPQDAAALIQQVLDFQPQQQQLHREYGYVETVVEEHLRKDGSVSKRKEEAFSVSPSPGGEYKRLIAKQGQALTEKQEAKEDEKFEKFLNKQAKLTAKERREQASNLSKRVERYQNRLLQALEVLDFTPEDDVIIGGISVRVFSFEPKPGYKPHSRATNILSRIEGSIAIDPARSQIARIHIRFRQNMNVLGGIFGRISKGSTATAVAKPDGDAWLMDRIDVVLNARFYFIKRYRRRMAYVYSDYQRFTVETEEKVKKSSYQLPVTESREPPTEHLFLDSGNW